MMQKTVSEGGPKRPSILPFPRVGKDSMWPVVLEYKQTFGNEISERDRERLSETRSTFRASAMDEGKLQKIDRMLTIAETTTSKASIKLATGMSIAYMSGKINDESFDFFLGFVESLESGKLNQFIDVEMANLSGKIHGNDLRAVTYMRELTETSQPYLKIMALSQFWGFHSEDPDPMKKIYAAIRTLESVH